MPELSQRDYVKALIAGCLGFSAYALLRPGNLAALVGGDEELARELGLRDLGSAIALALSPEPTGAIAARVFYDVSDAILFGRRRPRVAALALGFAGLGVAALKAR